jgi:hypothetical protein
MTPFSRYSSFAVTSCLVLGLHAPPAFAEPPAGARGSAAAPIAQSLSGEARAEYDAAVLLYEDGDFNGASLKFQRAYQLSKEPRLLWNAGACEKELRRYARTYALVSRYLSEASPKLTTEEKNEATELLRTIEGLVSHVTVSAEPAGVELLIDDAPIATLPTKEPIVADMGSRRFVFRKAGYKDATLTREVIGGTPLTLQVALEVDTKSGLLRVVAGSGDSIRVDGRPVGQGQWQGSLSIGTHALSVSAPNKKSFQTDVAIEAAQTTRIQVSLEPAGSDGSGFKSWPLVAGGVALVALASVGAYFAFGPDEASEPAPARGTIAPGYWSF